MNYIKVGKITAHILAYLLGAWLAYLFLCIVVFYIDANSKLDIVRHLPIQVFWGIPQVAGASSWDEAKPIWTNPWFP